MNELEIALLIIGAVFFVGSFFMTEKLSSSDLDEIKKLSEDEMRALIEKQLREAGDQMERTLSDKIEEKTEEFAAGADKETNNRIMSIGEYADSVFDSMTKTHDEIVFLYQMLNDKQEQMAKLTKTLGEAESHVRELLTEASRQRQERAADSALALGRGAAPLHMQPSDFPPLSKDSALVNVKKDRTSSPEDSSAKDAAAEAAELRAQDDMPAADLAAKEAEPAKMVREKIISMYHQGYSLLDIAKETGKGMGEVTLILELFDEKDEEGAQ